MHIPSEEQVEAALMNAARYTMYPPTPNLAAKVTRRLYRRTPVTALARAAAVLLVLFAALFATVPEIRAAVLAALRIGAVTLVREAPSPAPHGDVLTSVLLLDGETTLDEARAALPFDILLPPEFGEPDRVFLPSESGLGQSRGDFGVVPQRSVALVWMDGETVRLVLTIQHNDLYVLKYYPWAEVSTDVNGLPAFWLTEPHTIFGRDGETILRRVISAHVLAWQDDVLTYRIETDAEIDEAVRIAETLE